MMIDQRENEIRAYGYGRERAQKGLERKESTGHAAENPYAQAVYRKFVLPLAEAITADKAAVRGRGRPPAHIPLLAPCIPEPSALVAVRAALVHLMGRRGNNARTLIEMVGKAVYHEHLLEHFSGLDPELFHQVAEGAAARLSRDERQRLDAFRSGAEVKGITLPEWGKDDIERLGTWFVDAMAALGMVEVRTETRGKREALISSLAPEALELVDSIRERVMETSPYYLPCVEPPKPWSRWDCGGWHTDEMRRLMPYAVKSQARDIMRKADLSRELACINALQRTRWRINTRILDTLHALNGKVEMKEVLAQGDDPKPERPHWLQEKHAQEDMDADQLKEFRVWKRMLAKWHSKAKIRAIRWGRYRTALDVAEQYKEYPALWFVYFADFRGRKYALTTGVSPQGSDLQKSLLEFADGKPLLTQGAKDWFLITGANRFGYDKVDLEDRIRWAKDNHDAILQCARDPEANRWWLQPKKPLQFLAWCFEYAAWCEQGDEFRSRISVGMDGSCNGLQNFSAMLRDEVGGVATNLVPAAKPQDIYARVGKRTEELLRLAPPDDTWFRARWLQHGINRDIVKRSVMTLPYGSTRFSCSEFIAGDYLAEGYAPEFRDTEYLKAASYLSKFVWAAIGDVVLKAREAMEWLQHAASDIIAAGEKRIVWTTPSGFPVVQEYWEEDIKEISTKLAGRTRLKVHLRRDTPEKRRHRNGIAPNFIHSHDGAHLTLTTLDAADWGITDLHMVHDDFGCHAADAEWLYTIIRKQFVLMYEQNDPLADFQARYPQGTGPLPKPGTLDLRLVLQSKFFFS